MLRIPRKLKKHLRKNKDIRYATIVHRRLNKIAYVKHNSRIDVLTYYQTFSVRILPAIHNACLDIKIVSAPISEERLEVFRKLWKEHMQSHSPSFTIIDEYRLLDN